MSENDFSYFESKHTGGDKPKDRTIPRFHVQTIKMEHASTQAGRGIYEDREFVEIIVPGNRNSIVCEPVSEEHKARWPDAYKAFKEGREIPLEGTPLANWPPMSRARVEEWAYLKVRSVEDLAGVSDAVLARVGMGAYQERETARKFLEVARTGTGPLERLLADNQRMASEIKLLTGQLAELGATVDGLRAMAKERV